MADPTRGAGDPLPITPEEEGRFREWEKTLSERLTFSLEMEMKNLGKGESPFFPNTEMYRDRLRQELEKRFLEWEQGLSQRQLPDLEAELKELDEKREGMFENYKASLRREIADKKRKAQDR